jgi:SAM-dependent methyltransferase
MPLYHDFADVYDTIFTEKEDTTSFLKTHLKHPKVLDLACGTGTYALKMAESGDQVVGTDLDETMIAKAKAKSRQKNNLSFRVENMLDLTDENTYDSIYSIGNSIVHLDNDKTIELLFKKIYKALKTEGVFIMQVINYTRILDQNIDHLPTIENAGIVFKRTYSYHPPYINFDTTLIIDDDIIRNTVSLYPIRPKTIIHLLNHVGFKDITTYGSFNESSFDEESSIPFIAVAKKQV